MEEVILPSFPEYQSCTDCETDEDIQYPSDSLFDGKDTEILEMISKHRRSKRRSGSVMGFEATYDLVHRVAYASNVREIMLDCFAMDASTENLEVTWEAIKLNPKNDLSSLLEEGSTIINILGYIGVWRVKP